MEVGLMDCGGGALVNGGAGAAASAASTRSAISAIQPDIELEERGLIGYNSVEGAEEAGCVKTQSLNHQTAIELKIERALYNGHLKWTLNHICWDKEIVKTVHPRLRGNCKEKNMVEVNIATIETHVLGDDRLQRCQRPQTDIRT